jgi:hypothetical protein
MTLAGRWFLVGAYLPIIGVVLGAPLQAVAATLGYQLTRRGP